MEMYKLIKVHIQDKSSIIRLFLWMPLLLISPTIMAQTVEWAMQPKEYDSIEPIGKNLFKVTNNNKIGLINADGTVVVEPVCDDIIGYYENKALLVSNDDGKGERIIGCLTSNGTFHKFSKQFYTLTGQKFYSEGLISVSNEKGEKGYVDETGNNELCFEKKYKNIKPFSDGYAVVKGSNSNYLLIDREGYETTFRFPGGIGSSIVWLSSVYKGKLYVQDEDDKFYKSEMNVDAGKLSRTKEYVKKSLDYLSRLSSLSGCKKSVPYESKEHSGAKGLTPTQSNGLAGYYKSNKPILPYQLQFASHFMDGYAVVGHNGKKGILKYVDGTSFDVKLPSETIEYSANKKVKCSFTLTVPTVWKENIEIQLKDDEGQSVNLNKNVDNYSFEINPSSEQEKFILIITGEDLKLFETQLIYTFNKQKNEYTYPTRKVIKNTETEEISKHKKDKPDELCPYCRKKISECPYRGAAHNF